MTTHVSNPTDRVRFTFTRTAVQEAKDFVASGTFAPSQHEGK